MTRNLFDLSGRVAIVTGATKGLGRATAAGFAAAGASVVVSSRSQAACEAVASEIRRDASADVMPLSCHLGRWDSIPLFVEQVLTQFEQIDVLVNNAGISPASMTVTDVSEALWDKVMEVNLKGPLRLCSLVAPVMMRREGGSIINVASTEAYRGEPNNSAYSASKAALLNLSQAMAAEWAASGIRVNVVSPGPFATELMEGAERNSPGLAQSFAERTLIGRLGIPNEIVGTMVYLASDAASYVTGEDLIVSGGFIH